MSETRRILDLLAQGRITADEADRLLQALAAATSSATTSSSGAGAPSAPTPGGDDPGAKPKPRFLRIAVHRPANQWRSEKDVTIRVPIALVKGGMKLGAIIPGLAGKQMEARLRERGLDLDLSAIDASAIETLLEQSGEAMNIDIDSGKAQVRVSCE